MAQGGTDPLNLSLVSPESGDPWSRTAAHGVHRQVMKCSCRKVLARPGRLGTRWQAKNSYARFVPKQLSSFFFPSLEAGLANSTSHFWRCLWPQEGNVPALALASSAVLGDNVRLCASNNPRSRKERRDVGLGIHVTTGPNWHHAPNVRIFVWNQCLEQFVVCLMCVIFLVSLQMERVYGAGKPWHFYPR